MKAKSSVSGRIVALGVGLALGSWLVPAAAQKVVKIGLSAPLSGQIMGYGIDIEAGVKLAIEEANAAGIKLGGEPVRFELVSQDDGADATQAVAVARRLVDQKVAGVVGSMTSGASIAAAKVYGEAGIPQVSPSATNSAYTRQGYKTTFRVIGEDSQVGAVMARYMVGKMGVKSVAVVCNGTPWGHGIAEVVAKTVPAVGGTVSLREEATEAASDFKSILAAAREKNAQGIFLGAWGNQVAPLKKQMMESGMKAPLFGSSLASARFVDFAGKEVAEGIISADPGQPLEKMPGGPDFGKKFWPKYGTVVMYAPYAYDAANVLIRAMRAADSADPVKYLPAIDRAFGNARTITENPKFRVYEAVKN